MKVMRTYEIVDIPEIEKPGIYAIHNKANGKYYIGSAKNLYHRLSQHWCEIQCCHGINLKMEQDINTIEDIENFEYIIIEIFENGEVTNGQLKHIEDIYIKEFEAVKAGYNTYCSSVSGNMPISEVLVAKQYMTEHRRDCIIPFYALKEKMNRYKALAKEQGTSLNALIAHLLAEYFKDEESPV